jgi:hypothetical protein
MCDYSLQHLAPRPAKVGDRLVTTKFGGPYTTGFCAGNRVRGEHRFNPAPTARLKSRSVPPRQ